MFDNTQIDFSKLIVVSNSKLCKGDFLEQVKKIIANKPQMFVLREKELPDEEVEYLAAWCAKLCEEGKVQFCINSNVDIAFRIGVRNVHLPLSILENYCDKFDRFVKIGTSVHSREDMKMAISYGVDYVFAGHIFETDCKKGVKGRGLEFLRMICEMAYEHNIQVYAIGGIDDTNVKTVLDVGADGYCIMSGMMN